MALVKEAAAIAVTRIFRGLDTAQAEAAAAALAAAAAATAAPPPGSDAAAGAAYPPPLLPATSLPSPQAQLPAPGPSALALFATAGGAAPGSAATAAAPLVLLPSRFGAGPLQPHELAGLAISMADFDGAVHKVQPSVRREGFTTTPGVKWDDVGSLHEVGGWIAPAPGCTSTLSLSPPQQWGEGLRA